MSEGRRHPAPTPGCYQMPEEAHLSLQQTRDRLLLLARLAAPRSPHDDLAEAQLVLAPAALAHCFEELAERVDSSLRQARWPEPAPPA